MGFISPMEDVKVAQNTVGNVRAIFPVKNVSVKSIFL